MVNKHQDREFDHFAKKINEHGFVTEIFVITKNCNTTFILNINNYNALGGHYPIGKILNLSS